MDGTVLDMMLVYEDLDNHISDLGYDVRCFGYDPYNAKELSIDGLLRMVHLVLKKSFRVQRQNLFPLEN